MMRGPSHWAVAVRKPDGEIAEVSHSVRSVMARHRIWRLPIVRGVVALVESLGIGFKALGFSANAQLDEEEEVNSQSGIHYTLYPCPVSAPYPPRAPVLRILDAKAPACRRRADALRVSFDARRALMQRCLRIPGT